ncbi:MAG: tetratricopeptide repeat protein [Betaproteobacteria bacterium]|nr:MAG: tetratricopeptide repeat protein [Betaproteobacteria bacterium]
MSLINKMLRDLDQRHAPQGGSAGPASAALAEQVYPVPARKLASRFFWLTTAMLVLFAVGWVAWLVWPLTPRPAVSEIVPRSSQEKVSPPKAAASPPALSAVPAPRPAPAASSASKSPPPVAQALPAPRTGEANADTLPLAGEPAAPVPKRSARSSSSRSAPKKAASAPQMAPAQPVGAGETGSGKIDRRSTSAARDRAENEFRRAVNLVNQGRVAEGMDGFRGALKIDPKHEAARQTLVALLLESKRVDEAARVLRDGLAFNAGNTGFAMLLARIMVERKDVPAALSLLEKHAAPPDRNPDFHAFAAALYQRLERHQQAIDQYQAALRLAPSGGVWWLGLGISYQAVDRPSDALEAFTRAKAAGNLAPELLSFVDQRLKQLQ